METPSILPCPDAAPTAAGWFCGRIQAQVSDGVCRLCEGKRPPAAPSCPSPIGNGQSSIGNSLRRRRCPGCGDDLDLQATQRAMAEQYRTQDGKDS